MSNTSAATAQPVQTHLLEFARAFRAAARAVSFYPAAHPAARTALQALVDHARGALARNPLVVTVLPSTVLVNGAALETSDQLAAELAAMLHRHGVGALTLARAASTDAWRCLFGLLARRPEDVRAAGGIERLWKDTGHASPGLIEIDFGELLRGRVGGDMTELAGVVSHYLAEGVSLALPEGMLQSLAHAIEDTGPPPATPEARALRAQEQVESVLRALRSMTRLIQALDPGRLEDVFRQAAAVAARLGEDAMAELIARRGTPEAVVESINLVDMLVDHMSDAAVATFLSNAIIAAGGASSQLSGVFVALVPDPERRGRIMRAAQAAGARSVTLDEGLLDKWESVEQTLQDYSDRRYVPDEYARELQAARTRSSGGPGVAPDDPPERLAAWRASIDDRAVEEQDLQLLLDLNDLETDPFRWRDLLETLTAHAAEAAEAGRWEVAAAIVEAIASDAGDRGDLLRRPFALESLERLAATGVVQRSLAMMTSGPLATPPAMARLLSALGRPIVRAIVLRWIAERSDAARVRLEGLLATMGREAREGLRMLLGDGDWETRAVAVKLLHHLGGFEYVAALELLLADSHPRVQREAVQALAAAGSERAQEIVARGIARATGADRMALLELVARMDHDVGVPLLCRVLDSLDDAASARTALWIVHALACVRSDEAVGALRRVLERRQWTAPYRSGQVAAAASAALGRIGTDVALGTLRDLSTHGRLRVRRLARRELTRHGPGGGGSP
jgi:hypothetical protein